MPSILTRLRERARTLSFTRVPPSPSLLSSPSVPTIPLPTTRATHNDTTTITHAATNTMTSMTTASRLDRKILANPDAHLTSYESNDTHEHGNEQQHGHRGRGGNQDAAERVEFPVGLQPGPRRASGSGSVVLALRDTAERHERSNIEANTDEGESRRHSGEGGASGGEWTTFGRRQSGAGRTPRLNEFFFQQETAHEFKGKDESVKEKNTNSSPSNTLSSRAPGVGLESLETFGARTPELPLEGYPALIPVLFPMITESKNDMREEAQRTFPRHRLRSWAMRSGTSSQSLPNTLKLKKSKERSYATFLKQFQASPSRKSSSNNMDFDSMPNSPPRISRSASRSNKSLRSGRTPRRRASAEWYAFQASQNSEGQWPALVSREILRLSGAGGVEVDATGGNPASANGSLMADHEATIHLIPPQPAGSDEARYCDGFPARIALPTSQSLTQLSPGASISFNRLFFEADSVVFQRVTIQTRLVFYLNLVQASPTVFSSIAPALPSWRSRSKKYSSSRRREGGTATRLSAATVALYGERESHLTRRCYVPCKQKNPNSSKPLHHCQLHHPHH